MLPEQYDDYLTQSALQNQIGEQQKALYAPQLLEQVQQGQAILVEQTNPKKTVEEIILHLQGLDKDTHGNIIKWGDPKMNHIGIEHMKYLLTCIVNQGTILSHLNDRQIPKIMYSLSETLVDDLTINWRLYGIKNKTDLDVINDTVLLAMFFALNRALEQNEKNWLGKVTVESLNNGPRVPQPRKGGIWEKFKL